TVILGGGSCAPPPAASPVPPGSFCASAVEGAPRDRHAISSHNPLACRFICGGLIVVSLSSTGRSVHVRPFPGAHAETSGIEDPLVVGLANFEAGVACQLTPDWRPQLEDRVVRIRTGRCDGVGTEQKAV